MQWWWKMPNPQFPRAAMLQSKKRGLNCQAFLKLTQDRQENMITQLNSKNVLKVLPQ